MLISLDGLDNRVMHPDDHPNENHARELLELHTLGVDGGYTQRDVEMETARCLSGWTFTHDWRKFFTAQVAFDGARHDGGAKELLGVIPGGGQRADNLERVLEITCAHPATARHMARRLCRTFVADPAPEQGRGAGGGGARANDGALRPGASAHCLARQRASRRRAERC